MGTISISIKLIQNEQVDVGIPTSGSTLVVDVQVTSGTDSLRLHWGAIKGHVG